MQPDSWSLLQRDAPFPPLYSLQIEQLVVDRLGRGHRGGHVRKVVPRTGHITDLERQLVRARIANAILLEPVRMVHVKQTVRHKVPAQLLNLTATLGRHDGRIVQHVHQVDHDRVRDSRGFDGQQNETATLMHLVVLPAIDYDRPAATLGQL